MNKTNVSTPTTPIQTLEEYEELLKNYKVSNPAKYEAKLKSGEFDKYKAKLSGKVVEPPAPPVVLTPAQLLDKKTVTELKEMLTEKDIEPVGKKADLIELLLNSEEK